MYVSRRYGGLEVDVPTFMYPSPGGTWPPAGSANAGAADAWAGG
jgi:hypothetical protein